MPELPEMENYRIHLQQFITGKRIEKININREKSINETPMLFRKQTENHQVTGMKRRAKYLIFHLQNGSSLLLHLMLGGWMFYGSKAEKPDHKTQIEIVFDTDSYLYFFGLRLGYLHLLPADQLEKELSEIGSEPFAGSFSQDFFYKSAER
ncbi:DNA-formamidopyrimidine glycosylase family protein [Virgibacillus halophilus]|uniref:DNA-formamidopyrimidine glycosylase family protein n=1 Tax=Tigheibacillus halophilus TaxID=361280 RepID=A0ABU5C8V3_9BACI|nr:DNA-formamidopyrimidine glycosylase family protein [Virgibacillus halophilus]